ncbi:putative MFS family arabinose efflux permease [Pullulanibacillus pueri]|uniref:MFS transporter n=1 Tax=Pullulanibacillus pueri TaxID=1437324 RepID=A0A8J2ZV13_9BACL|nr:MFS transporter [Pullulanibacillus pueri]MBM7681606.1 putative MFS family arabinose efflux permease [Pullulanibacillus pueri]GGH79482.1 MFS transporter [Pullulanibacillus pueri]
MTDQSSKLWTTQFVMVIVLTFLFFLCLQSLTAGFPIFITGTTGSSSKGGLMTTFFMLGAIVIRPFIGIFVHKINMKITLISTLIFLTLTLAASLGQESFSLLMLLRFLQGMTFGIATTLLATFATQLIPTKRLGEGIGYFGLATSLGTSLAPMLALALLQSTPFIWLLGLTIVLALLTLVGSFFIKNKRSEPLAQTKTPRGSVLSYAFDKKAFMPTFLVMLFYITFSGIVNFIDGLGKESHIQDHTSLFFLVTAVAMIVTRPFSGRIYDRFGHKFLIIPSAICGIVGLLCLSQTGTTGGLILSAVFYGIAYGVIQPTLQAWAVSRVAPDKKGTANAMTLNFMDLGMALGAVSLGTVADATSFHKMFGTSSVLIFVFILLYILVTTLSGRSTKNKHSLQEQRRGA